MGFVATILIAAHEYDYSRRNWDAARGTATTSDTERVSEEARDDAPPSHATLFEDFAAARGHTCPQCHQSLRYRSHQLPQAEQDDVTVTYECSACGTETCIEFSAEGIAPAPEDESNGG